MSVFGYRKTSDLPARIPIFPLGGAVLYPRSALPLNVFEPRYLNMIDDVIAGDRVLGMIQPARDGHEDLPPPVMDIGCLGRITSFAETDDGRYLITLSGVIRFQVRAELAVDKPYRMVAADYAAYAEDLIAPRADYLMDRERLEAALRRYVQANGYAVDWERVERADAESLVNAISTLCPFEPAERQALLEARRLDERCATLITLLELNAFDDDGDHPLQ
jgi:hypothetical protein